MCVYRGSLSLSRLHPEFFLPICLPLRDKPSSDFWAGESDRPQTWCEPHCFLPGWRGPAPASQIQGGWKRQIGCRRHEEATGLEIGLQPRVEVRCVKQTGCCVKTVDPQMHPWVTCVHRSAFSDPPLRHCHDPPPFLHPLLKS